jgi:hypothetical protein
MILWFIILSFEASLKDRIMRDEAVADPTKS